MSTYILILMLWAGNSGALTSAEYGSQQACESAGRESVDKFARGLTSARFTCTAKAAP